MSKLLKKYNELKSKDKNKIYLFKVGIFYNGRTIYDVSIRYCPTENGEVNVEYADKVCEIAYNIYKRALESK